MNETITVSLKRYLQLLDDSVLLACLKEQGVDNWEGYHLAVAEAGSLDDEATEEEYMAEENETL